MKDELAKNQVPFQKSNFGSTFPRLALFCNPTLVPVPTLAPLSSDKLFKKFMKAYLDFNQGPSQTLAERKQPLKAKVPDVYYGKLHMDYYHFCQ